MLEMNIGSRGEAATEHVNILGEPQKKITRRTTGARGCYLLLSFNNFGLTQTIWDYPVLSGTISDYFGLSLTILNYI